MLKNLNLKKILFLDIETVPEEEKFEALSLYRQTLWEQKSAYQRGEDYTAEEFYDRAGIWAEFGKIVCISVGYFDPTLSETSFRLKSFWGEEKNLLVEFKQLLDSFFYQKSQLLCAHNGKEFDFPYIARRMIIHSVELPKLLQIAGKKPWEIQHLDTLQL